MSIDDILPIVQATISLLLIITILFQRRGAALSATFGGGDSVIKHTKRGFEKFLFIFSIVLASLFIVSSFASLVL